MRRAAGLHVENQTQWPLDATQHDPPLLAAQVHDGVLRVHDAAVDLPRGRAEEGGLLTPEVARLLLAMHHAVLANGDPVRGVPARCI